MCLWVVFLPLITILTGCAGNVHYTDKVVQKELTGNSAITTKVLATVVEWRDSGVIVRKGVTYNIKAKGRWRAAGTCDWTGPNGEGMYGLLCPPWDLGKVISGWPHQTLIGKISENGEPFAIGSEHELTPSEEGALYLKMNEQDAMMDNSGIMQVVITIAQSSLAQIPKRQQKELSTQYQSYLEPQQTNIDATVPAKQQEVALSTIIDYGRYYALVIGINDYRHLPKLRTAVNDAQTVADVLEKHYRFDVKLLLNPTRSDVLTTLNQYRKVLTVKDNLLIYYAGHGWLDTEADQGYWLPVDATRDNAVNWISNHSITSEVKAMLAKHVLIVADSCYSGKLVRGLHIKQKAPDYLIRISKKQARVVLTSGGLEPVADSGGKGNHSVFASAFIEVLSENTGVLDGTDLFLKIRRPVMVNSDQTPEYADMRKAGHDGGDFLFVRVK